MTSLQELDNLDVDIAVAPPDEYVDSSSQALPPKGRYQVVIKEFDFSRDENNEVDGRAVLLNALEITAAPAEVAAQWVGRHIYRLTIWTTPYQRRGVTVSGLGDLIRGIDHQANWSNLREAAELLQRAKDERIPIEMRLDWEAYDRDYFNELGGNNMPRKSPEQKQARKSSTVKGMQNFRRTPDGSYLPEVLGPSGNMLEARITIDSVISADKRK